MILIIDNYDSFTYNLVHLLAAETDRYRVVANDELTVAEIARLAPAGILLSPGPGRPADAGVSLEVVRELARTVPILGVCLGHQVIGEAHGARVVHAPELMHGKTSIVRHDGRGVFAGVPQDFAATRYHSLVVDEASLPRELEPTAWTPAGTLMGLRHRQFPLEGVQFHPESILTEAGHLLIRNWVRTLQPPVQPARRTPLATPTS